MNNVCGQINCAHAKYQSQKESQAVYYALMFTVGKLEGKRPLLFIL